MRAYWHGDKLEFSMDYFADIGLYAAIATCTAIIVWTVFAHLRWLPKWLSHPVQRPLLCLTLGLIVAILVGFAVPSFIVGAMAAIYFLSFALVAVMGLWVFLHSDMDDQPEEECEKTYMTYDSDEKLLMFNPWVVDSNPALPTNPIALNGL